MVNPSDVSKIVEARIHDTIMADHRFVEAYDVAVEARKAERLKEVLDAYVEKKLKTKRYAKRLENVDYYSLFHELQIKFEAVVEYLLEQEVSSDNELFQEIYDKFYSIIHNELWEKVTNELENAK